jgi:phytoene synthase
VAAVYAFARSADDFADEAKYRGRSLELLGYWRSVLETCSNGSTPVFTSRHPSLSSHPIFIALADTVQRCDLPVQLFQDLLTAFTMDVTKRRYADWEELLTYCRYSANPVGRLVLLIFGARDPKLHRLSDSICTGLQLTNHWQDLAVDMEKDLLYIPQTLLNRYRVREEDLKGWLQRGPPSSALPPSFRSLMADLIGRARVLFEEGEPLLKQVSGRLQWELKLTVLGGRAILDRMEEVQYDVFRRRPVLSRGDTGWSLPRVLNPLNPPSLANGSARLRGLCFFPLP